MRNIRCDENCGHCGAYTTVKTYDDKRKGVRVKEYDCLITGKTIREESEIDD